MSIFTPLLKLAKKSATLQLKTTQNMESKTPKGHLIWAMIDPKNMKKHFPFKRIKPSTSHFYADFHKNTSSLIICA